jgi:bile acid-coenzyme A ligase
MSVPEATTSLSYGERLRALADAQPDEPAYVFVPLEGPHDVVTRRELEEDTNRLARLLAEAGVGEETMLVLALPTHPLHPKVAHAAWKLGACVLPTSHRAPRRERELLLETAGTYRRVVTVGAWEDGEPPTVHVRDLDRRASYAADPLEPKVAAPSTAIGSGGTTGRPKIVLGETRGEVRFGEDGLPALSPLQRALGLRVGQVQLVCTPMYHASGFSWATTAVVAGNPLVLVERFDAGVVLDAVERYRVNHMMVVPAILQRLADWPGVESRDLSSLEALCHGGAPCPEPVKRRWLELIPPACLYEGYGATESFGATVVRGDEWLERPGTVGRPVHADVRILDDDGTPVPPGEVGEVFMRPVGATAPTFRYVGADYRQVTPDGFVTLGDYGRLDGDGYLYIADRRVDMIVTGGSNVYPAEVESALLEHPDVADVAVIGLPDERWGRRVHAVVQPRHGDRPPSVESLDAHCRDRLAPYKVPKSFELVDHLPRTEVGKLARGKLVEERIASV